MEDGSWLLGQVIVPIEQGRMGKNSLYSVINRELLVWMCSGTHGE